MSTLKVENGWDSSENGMKSRFDLEDKIMAAWNVVSDVKLLSETIYETNMTEDQVQNYLIGIEALYTMRFNDLFKTFEILIQQGNIK